jgi:hypothetical protein
LSGEYEVQGTNPGDFGSYTGIAIIIPDSDGYFITWKINALLSLPYQASGRIVNGRLEVVGETFEATYEILPNGILDGTWREPTALIPLEGTERLIPKRD